MHISSASATQISMLQHPVTHCTAVACIVAVYCSVLQCVATVLQRVAEYVYASMRVSNYS